MKWMAAVMAMAAAVACAAEPTRPDWLWTKPDPVVLRWQMEAQERARAIARRIDEQIERAKRQAAERGGKR